ncbi:ABC transporter substrate-binding protein [Thalassomonas sp. M1454]|uniref:ABC transporter substrate-binding protein n=1 Tax=Thalassomonas sp. M1454 TaxID=2594477 RepID=UPI00117F1DEB|nr:ABC transporter substrate-binding protein [Thalassomonas sp. M1454]TRX57250.1 ABC transporter substrate-binding protein [Thalassomonas sp. M1454]
MTFNLRLITKIIPLGLLFTALSGCNPSTDDSVLSEGIVYCSEGAPSSFNPQLITDGTTIDATSKQLYNRLIDFNNTNLQRIPALAKSWHVTRNGKLITFYLRRDVSFHRTDYFSPTRTMNADDVIFSFNRILDPNNPFYQSVAGKFPFFQSVNFHDLVDSIEKIDDYTVRFKLNRADSTFLSNLATPFAVILSEEYAQQLVAENDPQTLGKLDSLPVGTGPFKFKQYRNNSFIRYAKHDNYWRQDVEIEKLIYNITPSNTGRLTKLLTHECDVISFPIAADEIKSRPDLALEEVTSFNVAFFAFNAQKPPFDNPTVRKAIAHAVDKKSIMKAVYADHAEIAQSLLPQASWAFTDEVTTFEYSVEKAKQLLANAGLSAGFSFDLWAMPLQRDYNPNALKMAKLIKADLAAIGVEVNIITWEWSTFLRKLARGEHQSVLIGWTADHPDPDNFFSPLLSCSAMETGRNRAFWCHDEFDQLLAKALASNDIDERKSLYLQAQNILVEQMPLLPIAHSKRAQAKVVGVSGDILAPFGGISFENINKTNGEN